MSLIGSMLTYTVFEMCWEEFSVWASPAADIQDKAVFVTERLESAQRAVMKSPDLHV